METRVCKICNESKLFSKFELYITPKGKRHRRYQCNVCRNKKLMEANYLRSLIRCPNCGEEKPRFEFVRENGLDFQEYGKICRLCAYEKNLLFRNKIIKESKKVVFKTPEETRKHIRKKARETNKKTKEWMINQFGDKCEICKKSFPWYGYDFHHINSEDKEVKISRYTKLTIKHLLSLPEFKEELSKCILVCAICHRKLHLNGGG